MWFETIFLFFFLFFLGSLFCIPFCRSFFCRDARSVVLKSNSIWWCLLCEMGCDVMLMLISGQEFRLLQSKRTNNFSFNWKKKKDFLSTSFKMFGKWSILHKMEFSGKTTTRTYTDVYTFVLFCCYSFSFPIKWMRPRYNSRFKCNFLILRLLALDELIKNANSFVFLSNNGSSATKQKKNTHKRRT